MVDEAVKSGIGLSMPITPYQRALHATFDASDKPGDAMAQTLELLPEATIALPMSHRIATRENKRWNTTLIILGTDDVLKSCADHILSSKPERLARLVMMDVQPGIEMLYAKSNGLKIEPRMIQFIEYVFSDPSEREDYYASQYDTSAPAMRSLWEKGLVGRFLGFENPDVLYCVPGFPNWDVLHLIGLTPWQMLRFMPRVNSFFDRFAKQTGRVSRNELFNKWDRQREIIKLRAKQL